MIARTLGFGSPGRLSFRLDQLVYEGEGNVRRTFPMEDVGFVLIEHPQLVITATCLAKLAAANVAVIVCDGAHMPIAAMQPYAAHTTAQETVAAQMAATEAVNGRLWRQIVRCKILNQAAFLAFMGKSAAGRLETLADAVKNRDEANCEAQAARLYFQSLMPPRRHTRPRGTLAQRSAQLRLCDFASRRGARLGRLRPFLPEGHPSPQPVQCLLSGGRHDGTLSPVRGPLCAGRRAAVRCAREGTFQGGQNPAAADADERRDAGRLAASADGGALLHDRVPRTVLPREGRQTRFAATGCLNFSRKHFPPIPSCGSM